MSPPLEIELMVGGESVSLVEGEPTRLSRAVGVDEAMSFCVRPVKRLAKAGVSFESPSRFVYEADVTDPEDRSWTVEDSSVVLTLTRLQSALTPADTVATVEEQLAGSRELPEPPTIRLGGHEVRGAGVLFELGPEVKSVDRSSRFLPPAGRRTG